MSDFFSCTRCSDRGVVHPSIDVFAWCRCVLGTLLREQDARMHVGAAGDYTEFYAQRDRSYEQRSNSWAPSE